MAGKTSGDVTTRIKCLLSTEFVLVTLRDMSQKTAGTPTVDDRPLESAREAAGNPPAAEPTANQVLGRALGSNPGISRHGGSVAVQPLGYCCRRSGERWPHSATSDAWGPPADTRGPCKAHRAQEKTSHVSCGRAVQFSGRILTRVYQLARGPLLLSLN